MSENKIYIRIYIHPFLQSNKCHNLNNVGSLISKSPFLLQIQITQKNDIRRMKLNNIGIDITIYLATKTKVVNTFW